MLSLPEPYLTPEEYLAIERKSEIKHEYWKGRMWPLGNPPLSTWAPKLPHVQINTNVVGELHHQLKGQDCELLLSDIRIRTASNVYAHPDAIVVGVKPEFTDAELDTLLNPLVLVEILSPTTELADRGKKLGAYLAIVTAISLD